MEKIWKSLNVVKSAILVADSQVTRKIEGFFSIKGYLNDNSVPFFASHIPLFVKIDIYLFFLLVLLIPLKIVFPESKIRAFFTYATFIFLILGIFAVFFAFFQLMYNF